MAPSIDLASSCVVVAAALGALSGHALAGRRSRSGGVGYGRSLLLHAIAPVAERLAEAGVSASTVTGAALALCLPVALLAAGGHFGGAALAFVIASLADGVDGLVARRTGTTSPAGALFDAAVDRYGEALFLGGVAIALRERTYALALTLGALLGGFMISYGSAKAEALRVRVPGGPMRRAERAAWLVAGAALTPLWAALARRGWVPAWTDDAPLVLALAVIAIVGNLSAARRLRTIAAAASPAPTREANDRASVPAE